MRSLSATPFVTRLKRKGETPRKSSSHPSSEQHPHIGVAAFDGSLSASVSFFNSGLFLFRAPPELVGAKPGSVLFVQVGS